MNVELGILTVVTFLPLVGALVVAVLPTSWTRPVALGFALATWVVSLLLLVGYLPDRAGAQFQYVEAYDWIPIFGIQYKLGVDGLSAALVVLTTTLTWICILASWAPIQTRIKEFMISFLVLEVGMIGVFLALDLFLFYIFWEVVLVPMYLIIGIWGGANRIYSTIKFVLYTLVGSLLMLVAILATAFAYQSATGIVDGRIRPGRAARTCRRPSASRPVLQIGAFLAFFLAFAIKVPMFPFHTWLPDAHTDAPDRRLGHPGRRPAQARGVRVPPLRAAALSGRRPHVRDADHRACRSSRSSTARSSRSSSPISNGWSPTPRSATWAS